MTAHHAGGTVLICLYRVSGLNSKIAGAYSRKTTLTHACPHGGCAISTGPGSLLGTKEPLAGQVADVLIGGVLGRVKTYSVTVCSHGTDILVPGKLVITVLVELASKGTELVLQVGSVAELPGAELMADSRTELGSDSRTKLGTDPSAVVAGGKGPVGNLGGDTLGDITDNIDILAQAVAELLNGLKLLGGHAFVLLQTLELSGIVGF